MRHHTARLASKALVFILVLAFGVGGFVSTNARAQVDSPLPIYAIEGRVLDDKGNAKADVLVQLTDDDGAPVGNDTTNASGGYEFTDLAAGKYLLQARHACCSPASAAVQVGGANVRTTAPDIYLTPLQPVQGEAVLFSGVVHDSATDAPIPVARLEIGSSYGGDGQDQCDGDVCRAYPATYQYFWTETDQDGRFAIEINRGTADVRVYREGYDITHGTLDVADDLAVSIPMRANGDTMVTLFGTLTNTQGDAVPNGWVNVGPDYRASSRSGTSTGSAEPATDAGGADGTWWYEDSDQSWGYAQADDQGRWEIQVSAGSHQVQGGAADYVEDIEYLQTQPGDRKEVALVLERIPPDSVTIRGRVTDAATGEGIPYADVSAENQRWGSWASAQTAADGTFTLTTKPGYTILTASAYRWYYARCEAQTMDAPASEPGPDGASGKSSMVAPCQSGERDTEYMPRILVLTPAEGQTLDQDFALRARPAPTAEFLGYVLDGATQTGVAGAHVTFFNELTRDWGEATTDEDGSYRIKVHAGYYTVRVWAEGYFDGAANADVGDDESQRLDISVTAGQKRYGYWGGCCYAVAEDSMSSSGGAPVMSTGGMSAAEGARAGAPTPTGGQQAYAGSAGGLGPYSPDGGGQAPSLAPHAAVLGLVVVALVLGRRRKD